MHEQKEAQQTFHLSIWENSSEYASKTGPAPPATITQQDPELESEVVCKTEEKRQLDPEQHQEVSLKQRIQDLP